MENAKNNMEKDRAKGQAKAEFESIKEMVFRLKHARECNGDMEICELDSAEILRALESNKKEATQDHYDEYHDESAALDRIHFSPLSIEVRSDWHPPGDSEGGKPSEYRILLCTGGPAVQILGDLDMHGQPKCARLQYQDWFKPWTDYPLSKEEEDVLLTYAQSFYEVTGEKVLDFSRGMNRPLYKA